MQEGRDRREKRLVELLKRLKPEEVKDIPSAVETLTRILSDSSRL